MTQRVPDLLPPTEAFAPIANDQEPTPFEILQAQGELLGERTQGDVRGEVMPTQGMPGQMTFWFTLFAPTLDYRFRLFLVQHGIESYPLEISRNRGEEPMRAENREQLYERVRALLAESRTTQAIRQVRQLVAEGARGE